MTAGSVTLCFALAMGLAACRDDPDESAPTTEETSSSSTTSTAPERPASTTTTAFDPASVEGEVEAAYLRSWDVYADAVYDLVLDEEALEEVYAEASLEDRRRSEIEAPSRRRVELRWCAVDHDYDIERHLAPTTALVVDAYVNHQVLIDPDTKEPVEADPQQHARYAFNDAPDRRPHGM